jgi:hypothetical protein
MTREENTAAPRPEQVKKTYRAPELHEYGNIREITRVGFTTGGNDHGQGQGNDKSGGGG